MNNETKKFVDFVLKDNENEVFFINLVARSKYLTPEEQKEVSCSSHMLDIKLFKPKKNIDNYNEYDKILHRYNCDEEGYIDRNGNPLPYKCRVVYAGVNPVDIELATFKFKQELVSVEYKVLKNNQDRVGYMSGIPRLFLKNCTNSRKKKNIIDIDVDIDLNDVQTENLKELKSYLKDTLSKEKANDIAIVYTKGGFHLLCKTANFDRDWHTEILTRIVKDFMCDAKEVKLNNNEMCPLPGTMYAEHFVTMEGLND